jgi:serine/threonine protein kinase
MSYQHQSDAVGFSDSIEVGTRIGPDGMYVIDGVIGSGGWGIVYSARCAQERVAIKEFYPQSIARRSTRTLQAQFSGNLATFQRGLASFREEANKLRKLSHPGIVPVRDYFEEHGTGFIVMRFLEGSQPGMPAPTLDALITQGEFKSRGEIERLTQDLLEILEFLHTRDVIHRDISPDNILMVGVGERRPVLIDFGTARALTAGLSQSMDAVVKPGYTPIEQYAAEEAISGKPHPSADIYSTAAVLYRLVAGEKPPQAPVRASNELYRPLASRGLTDFSQNFLRGVDAGLALREAARPQSAAQWRTMLFPQLPSPLQPRSDAGRMRIAIAIGAAILAAVAGFALGRSVGMFAGQSAGYSTGYTDGSTSGYADGKTAGYTEGKAAGEESGKAAGLAEGLATPINCGAAGRWVVTRTFKNNSDPHTYDGALWLSADTCVLGDSKPPSYRGMWIEQTRAGKWQPDAVASDNGVTVAADASWLYFKVNSDGSVDVSKMDFLNAGAESLKVVPLYTMNYNSTKGCYERESSALDVSLCSWPKGLRF